MLKPEYLTSEYWNTVWSRPYTNYEKHHQIFWDEIKKLVNGSAIDLACGSASCWKGWNREITCVDFSKEAIEQAKKNVKNGKFIVANITKVPYIGTFDTVVLCGVINYYRNLEPIKYQVLKLSKLGTSVILTINVIKDFLDREWTEELVKEEFSTWGSDLDYKFYKDIGWLIKITI